MTVGPMARFSWRCVPSSYASAMKLSLFVSILLVSAVTADDDNPVTRNFKCRPNGCCDHHEWCRFWASMGECRTNLHWMNENCQLACNTCNRAPLRQAQFTRPPSPGPVPLPVARQPQRQAVPLPTRAPIPVRVTTRPPPPRRPVPLPNQARPVVRRPPPPPPPPPTTTQAPFTRRPNPFFNTPTTRPPPPLPPRNPNMSPLARCKQIQADASNSAEVLWRERLVNPTEDTSGRRQLSADIVIRSNIANACVPRLDEAECERSMCYNLYYRTMDGTCNNFRFPLRGAAYRPYSRLMPPEYDNGLSEPVSSLRNLRPSPREANRLILSSSKTVPSTEFNALLMQFGQFMSHDMAKTTLVPSAKCNVCQNIPGRCMAIFITPSDPNRNFKNDVCLRVSRSSAICGSGRSKPRQQLNENTGFIDGSPIYGSSIGDMHKFRQGNTGFLKLENFNGMRVLPFDRSKCRNANDCTATFVAGDSRVNLFLGLTSYHLLFTREHNRVASILQRLNPHWNGDRLFQEARKIVGAQIQAICYREYLPKVLGSAFASTVGIYRGYDPNVDPTIANEFTAGAYRFGHGMIQEFYPRLDERNRTIGFGGFQFVDGTLHSDHLIFQGGVDPILRGLMATPLKRPQRLTTTITEQMFGSTDLGTINIQRGRDHGIPSYMRFRQLCGLSSASTFDQARLTVILSREILSSTARASLQRVYRSPDRIDFYVGALLEDPVVRGLVGPTVACVIGPQFARSRDGDRFYFENPGIFTRSQLAEIRRSSLARIICNNGDNINFVPREAFRLGPIVSCNEIPQMDLTKWKE